MPHLASDKLLFSAACLCLLVSSTVQSQIIIREKVEIKPKPAVRSAQTTLTSEIRVESSFNGSVDPDLPHLIWLKGPCGVNEGSGSVSGMLTAPAYDGIYKAGYRFTNPAGESGGQFRFAVYLGDSLLREFNTPVSCPTGCTLFDEWNIQVFAGFTFSPQYATIGSRGTNTFGAVESTSTAPCSPGAWMADWAIELEITKGQDVGSFVDGAKRSYTVVKKKSEFLTFGFLADGEKGYGDVEITARSGGITVVKGFTVIAPAPKVKIVPPWWWYGQPIKLAFDNLPVLEFSETHSPSAGQKFEPVITWEPDDTINTANYFNLVDALYVKVRAENAGGVARDSVKLVFQTECIKVDFDPAELSVGDTARLSFQRLKEDGTVEDLPLGLYTFSVTIVGGEDSSKGIFVTEEEEPKGGTTLLNASAPILYVAPGSIPDTLMSVHVLASAWEVIWWKRDEVKSQAAGVLQFSAKQTEERGQKDGKTKAGIVERLAAARLAAMLSDWCPISKVVVKSSAAAITLDIPTPKEIWPTLPPGSGGNPGRRNLKERITITVTKGGVPASNYEVEISAKMILPSGGHEHTEQPPKALLGELKDVTTGRTGKGELKTRTDENGTIRLEYTTPEFSGRLEFTAKSTTASVEDKDTLVVKMPNLAELGVGEYYELVGAPDNHAGTNDPCRASPPTSRHNNNHLGTAALISAIENIAASYDSLHPGTRLRINDMSLEWGGLFDVANNWQVPHREHRIGKNADVGFTGINTRNECVSLNRRQLLQRIRAFTVGPTIVHSDHYHIRAN